MSSSTKKKHVMAEVLDQFDLPKESETIVRIVGGRGNNLHMVEEAPRDGLACDQFLVSMPRKFRRSVWVKRGDYVVVQPIEEGDKVKAEIVRVLYKEQIKYIKDEGKWPDGFATEEGESKKAADQDELARTASELKVEGSEEEEEDSDSDLFVNTNHRTVTYEESEEDSSDDDESADDEDEGRGEDKETRDH